MAFGDLPSMGTGTYASNTLNLAAAVCGQQLLGGQLQNNFATPAIGAAAQAEAYVNALNKSVNQFQPLPAVKENSPVAARRLVQVFIADPDDNIPLDQSLLYSGDQKLTDATDQELFFEINIKTLLDAHNEKRVLLTNKKVKERTEHLEPAKIRDLKMVVVTVATF